MINLKSLIDTFGIAQSSFEHYFQPLYHTKSEFNKIYIILNKKYCIFLYKYIAAKQMTEINPFILQKLIDLSNLKKIYIKVENSIEVIIKSIEDQPEYLNIDLSITNVIVLLIKQYVNVYLINYHQKNLICLD